MSCHNNDELYRQPLKQSLRTWVCGVAIVSIAISGIWTLIAAGLALSIWFLVSVGSLAYVLISVHLEEAP